jgi:serine/threonine-protein kinase
MCSLDAYSSQNIAEQQSELELSRAVIHPTFGEVITSLATRNTYTIQHKIGEGSFGVVYGCQDVWGNDLAAKVLKPNGSYEAVKAAANAEFIKLFQTRNPFITFVYDAFEYRDTFYIITERCHGPVLELFSLDNFNGQVWLMPIARCLLQAIHYLHLNGLAHQDIHLNNVFSTYIKDQ